MFSKIFGANYDWWLYVYVSCFIHPFFVNFFTSYLGVSSPSLCSHSPYWPFYAYCYFTLKILLFIWKSLIFSELHTQIVVYFVSTCHYTLCVDSFNGSYLVSLIILLFLLSSILYASCLLLCLCIHKTWDSVISLDSFSLINFSIINS